MEPHNGLWNRFQRISKTFSLTMIIQKMRNTLERIMLATMRRNLDEYNYNFELSFNMSITKSLTIGIPVLANAFKLIF